jgi:hypothetical protein
MLPDTFLNASASCKRFKKIYRPSGHGLGSWKDLSVGLVCCMATNTLLIVHAGLVLVIPYGILSEKIGGRFVAALNLFGYALSSVWIIIVCESSLKVQRANLFT